jgi:hypothetical protein
MVDFLVNAPIQCFFGDYFVKLNHDQPQTIIIANPDARLWQHRHDSGNAFVPFL